MLFTPHVFLSLLGLTQNYYPCSLSVLVPLLMPPISLEGPNDLGWGSADTQAWIFQSNKEQPERSQPADKAPPESPAQIINAAKAIPDIKKNSKITPALITKLTHLPPSPWEGLGPRARAQKVAGSNPGWFDRSKVTLAC